MMSSLSSIRRISTAQQFKWKWYERVGRKKLVMILYARIRTVLYIIAVQVNRSMTKCLRGKTLINVILAYELFVRSHILNAFH